MLLPFIEETGFLDIAHSDPPGRERARELAERHGWRELGVAGEFGWPRPSRQPREPEWPSQVYLSASVECLDLRALDAPKLAPLRVEFERGALAYRSKQGGGEMLAKALGVKSSERACVLDLTLGLARDAFVLASLGMRVIGVEREAPIFELLRDGLLRATNAGGAAAHAASRIVPTLGDSRALLASLVDAHGPSAIYLDPMYPSERGSAVPAKPMRLLRALTGEEHADSDEALLRAAIATGVRRVVVKRPLRAPELGGIAPHHAHRGKSTRFDVYGS